MKEAIVRFLVVTTFGLFPCVLVAQSQPGAALKVGAATATAVAEHRLPAKPKLTDDEKLALNILESSEAASRGLEAPMRSYSLLQIASSFPIPDEKRSRALLHDAFIASLQIQDDDATKSRLQEDVLRALLPLSLDDVQELLPQAEIKVRKQISENIVGFYTGKKEFEKAIDLVNQVTAWDEFPYRSGGELMDALPADMMAEKQGLFLQAVNSYKNHKHSGIQVGGTLTDIIVRHSGAMAPQVVLSAIDDVLSQARSQDEENHGYTMTIGGSGGSVSFHGNYQYQLFALLPIIQQLDESRAKSLLDENQALQAELQQYPLGMQSLMPTPKEPPKTTDTGDKKQGPPANTRVERLITSTNQKNSAMSAQMLATEQARQQMQQVIEEAEKDPVQALAHTTTLPIVIGDWPLSPRGNALAAIGQVSAKKTPSVASQALSELRKIVPDMPLGGQAQALQSAANVYMKMGDTESAEKAIGEGFKVADKLLEKDLNPDDPNQGLKAWWPSADAYRRFVELQTKISPRDTLNLLKEIKDPEIRTLQSIMYARALLGMPMKSTTVVEKRKDMNRWSRTGLD